MSLWNVETLERRENLYFLWKQVFPNEARSPNYKGGVVHVAVGG